MNRRGRDESAPESWSEFPSGSEGPTLTVGILGAGAIGRVLAHALDSGVVAAKLAALADQDLKKAHALSAELAARPPIVTLNELVERAGLIVEAASQAAVAELVPKALERGRDVLILSVGGLLGHEEWVSQAATRGCGIYIPSGAIGGLDAIRAAAMGRIDGAVLTSRKPVAALADSRYVLERGLDLKRLIQETVIFEGPAEQAARAFPQTSNVAASVRLALGPRAPLLVRVVAAPGARKNVHELSLEGEFGRLTVTVENVPSPDNPRTSQLAAFSAVAALRSLAGALRVGV
jgi:aspartate dehydrogenase